MVIFFIVGFCLGRITYVVLKFLIEQSEFKYFEAPFISKLGKDIEFRSKMRDTYRKDKKNEKNNSNKLNKSLITKHPFLISPIPIKRKRMVQI